MVNYIAYAAVVLLVTAECGSGLTRSGPDPSTRNLPELLSAFRTAWLHVIIFQDIDLSGVHGQLEAPVVLSNLAACVKGHRYYPRCRKAWDTAPRQRGLHNVIGLHHFVIEVVPIPTTTGGGFLDTLLSQFLHGYQTSFFTNICPSCTDHGYLHFLSSASGEEEHQSSLGQLLPATLFAYNNPISLSTILWNLAPVQTDVRTMAGKSEGVIFEVDTGSVYCGKTSWCLRRKISAREISFNSRVVTLLVDEQIQHFMKAGLIKVHPTCLTCSSSSEAATFIVSGFMLPDSAQINGNHSESFPVIVAEFDANYDSYSALIHELLGSSETAAYNFISCSSVQIGQISFQGYHNPFQWGVWVSLLVSLIVSSLSMAVLSELRQKSEGQGSGNRSSTIAIIGWSAHAFCSHLADQCEVSPQLARLRYFNMIYCCWLLAGIVLSNAYRGIVTTDLTASPPEKYPEAFVDLLQHGFQLYSNPTKSRPFYVDLVKRFSTPGYNVTAKELNFYGYGIRNKSYLSSQEFLVEYLRMGTAVGHAIWYSRLNEDFSQTSNQDMQDQLEKVFNSIPVLLDEVGPDLGRFVKEKDAGTKIAFVDTVGNIDSIFSSGVLGSLACRKGSDELLKSPLIWYARSPLPLMEYLQRRWQSLFQSNLIRKQKKDAYAADARLVRRKVRAEQGANTLSGTRGEGPQALTMTTNISAVFVVHVTSILIAVAAFLIEIRVRLHRVLLRSLLKFKKNKAHLAISILRFLQKPRKVPTRYCNVDSLINIF